MRIPDFFGKRAETRVDPVTGTVVTTPPYTTPTAHERARAEQREAEAADKARREAYKTGRHDAAVAAKTAQKRRGHPVLATLVVLVALVGALWVALAVREGSFTGAGQVVDTTLAEVTVPARDVARNAADRSGAAVTNAGQVIAQQGQAIEQQGEKIRNSVE